MLQEFTGRPADVLKQNEDSAHGGDGWEPRLGTRLDDLGPIWEPCGVPAEWYPRRTVLTHRPGGVIVEDEGVAGTGHVALGSNIHFGGLNAAPLHLDFVYHDPTLWLDGFEVEIAGD